MVRGSILGNSSEKKKEEFILPEEYRKELRSSPYPFRDAIYNWLVTQHAKRGKSWTTTGFFSDKVWWSFGLDQIWSWVPSLAFLYLMYYLANYTYVNYGLFKAATVLVVMATIRVNALVRQVAYTNRLLKERL